MSDETTRARLALEARIVKMHREWDAERAAHAETVQRLEQERDDFSWRLEQMETLLHRTSIERNQATAEVQRLTALVEWKTAEREELQRAGTINLRTAPETPKETAAPDGDVTP
jgi:predicted acetyltransferase